MIVISTAVMAATPSLLPGVVGDLATTLNFAAVFDVEIAVHCPAVPMIIEEVDAGGKQVVPLMAGGTTGAADLTTNLEDAAGPDLPIATDIVSADSQSAVIQSPNLVLDLPVAVVSIMTQIAPAQAVSTAESGEENPLTQSPVAKRASLIAAKLALAVAKTKMPQQLSEPMATERTSKTVVAADVPLIALGQQSTTALDHAAPAIQSDRPLPAAALPHNTPVERLLAALSHNRPAERQWLDTVIRDVASVAVRSGDVRFRVDSEGYGRMIIERTADRLEISVSEPRSMAVAEAARPQVLAGAATLGVPVAGATVVLDQSGQRGREEAPPRQQIEHRDADEAGENLSADLGRYA